LGSVFLHDLELVPVYVVIAVVGVFLLELIGEELQLVLADRPEAGSCY
jgi:hypothetical protein